MQPDRHMHLFATTGIADGEEVHPTLSITIIDGRAAWLINGEPLSWTTDPMLVDRTNRLIDKVLGRPTIAIEPEVEHPYEGAWTIAS